NSIGKKIGPTTKEYGWKDVVLYALGVGAGFDELDYCYETRLKVLPSFSIAAIFEFLAEIGLTAEVNLAGVLHGEQDLIFHNPIPPEGKLITEGRIANIYDKGKDKGALIVGEGVTYHSNGQKLFTSITTVFGRLDGGFGGPDSPKEPVEFPDRPPDYEEDARPTADQPLLYRLSGDIFALHVDPDFARASGFEKPIMHGLCTHGYACRAVIKHLFPGEPERMTRFRNRFSKPLYPGVPIRTQIWKIEEGLALFRTINAETGEVAIDRGIVEWISREEFQQRQSGGWVRFDDRVAVVTGAGAGLGRTYALELARRGAKVVVNDLGGARDGSGGSTGPADKVVEEIRTMGGEAVASYDSVATAEGGEAIINKAIESFGRVDIVINNAGILRDKTLLKMEPSEWESVMSVHLDGAYNVTRPAFLKMREQGYGRIVVTSSSAGLYGNFGQSNYSAAKMALVGFMNSLKLEGEKYNIKVNTIAPIAATRLTEDVLPPDLFDKLKPEFVTPLVIYLCSEQCPVTGRIYNAGAGYFSRAEVVTGRAVTVGDRQQVPAVEEVARNMKRIKSLEAATGSHDATTALADMMAALSAPASAPQEAEPAPKLTVAGIFDGITGAFRSDKAAGVDVVFQFKISGPTGGDWYVTIKDGACTCVKGAHEKPTTTILMGDADFVAMISGKLNAMKAYTSGKLKIEGDLMKSQLIEKLFKF
ncbi:MAG: SDR family NAD(P)-dependent oxidoreductase, partial [Desulfomonile sp.]|nr:SDR family NAD(P)-dependent oxidoreductase [Desulfomonile sp.]